MTLSQDHRSPSSMWSSESLTQLLSCSRTEPRCQGADQGPREPLSQPVVPSRKDTCGEEGGSDPMALGQACLAG